MTGKTLTWAMPMAVIPFNQKFDVWNIILDNIFDEQRSNDVLSKTVENI